MDSSKQVIDDHLNIIITGASGVLGADLLPALQNRYTKAKIYTITRSSLGNFRASDTVHIRQDLSSVYGRNLEFLEAIRIADIVIHLAANVSWILDAEESIDANTTSTSRLLAYCKQHSTRLRKFIHISTAYIQDRKRPYKTKQAGERCEFNNNYELSKFLSEQAVIESGLPYAIVRPSLVVGRSDTGYIDSFNGLYYIARFYCTGNFAIAAYEPDATVDIVPVDYVTESILSAIHHESDAAVFWAVGLSKAPSCSEIMEQLHDSVNYFRRIQGFELLDMPEVVSPRLWEQQFRSLILRNAAPSLQKIVSYLDAFIPYFSLYGEFLPGDKDHLIQAPAADLYLPKVINFWCENNLQTVLRDKKVKLSASPVE